MLHRSSASLKVAKFMVVLNDKHLMMGADDLPMSCSSNGIFSSHNNGIVGEVMGSWFTGCLYILPIKNNSNRCVFSLMVS